jgi:hypothetical protein
MTSAMLNKNGEFSMVKKHLAMLQTNLDTLLFYSNLLCPDPVGSFFLKKLRCFVDGRIATRQKVDFQIATLKMSPPLVNVP